MPKWVIIDLITHFKLVLCQQVYSSHSFLLYCCGIYSPVLWEFELSPSGDWAMFFGNLPPVKQSFALGRTIVCLKANLCLPLGKWTQTIELKCLVHRVGRQCKDTINGRQKQEKCKFFIVLLKWSVKISFLIFNKSSKTFVGFVFSVYLCTKQKSIVFLN